jgi:hypothetical protein
VVKGITTFLGWLTGAATLAYAGGVGIYALRLALYEIPSPGATASALPKEVLITTSLTEIGLPALVVVGAYVFVRMGSSASAVPKSILSSLEARTEEGRNRGLSVVGYLGVAPLVLSLLLVLPGWILVTGRPEGTWQFKAIAWLASLLFVVVAFSIREMIIANDAAARFGWWRFSLAMSCVYVLAILPGAVVFGASLPLSPVKVCATNAEFAKSGLLVGMTSDRVFIAEKNPKHVSIGPDGSVPNIEGRRMAVISADKVEEAFIGSQAEFLTCDTKAPASPTSAAGG